MPKNCLTYKWRTEFLYYVFLFNYETSCASYLIDCEYRMWELYVVDSDKSKWHGRDGKFPQEIWDNLISLSKKLNCWFHWSDGMSKEDTIPLKEWMPMYDAWRSNGECNCRDDDENMS